MEIGNRVKTLRTEYNLTQKQLADKLGLTPKMISFYESGQRIPPIDIVEKLSSIFSKSADYLIGLSSDSKDDVFLSPKDQQILDFFHQDPERVMELLSSFSKLSARNKTIILGKCFELEDEDKGKNNTEQQYKEKDIRKAT